MSDAKRRQRADQQESPAVPDEERQAILLRGFRYDLAYWIATDPRLALRIMRLIEEILRDPFTGLGKPEPLKHRGQGQWSRRITDGDRMIYRVRDSGILFLYARGHYGQR